MWRTVAVLLGAVVLVTAGAVAGSALAAAAGGGTVYIATGENFPDAVTAGAAGGPVAGPVLLVRQNSIPSPTLDELNRLQPDTIVIVGGTAVISQSVEDQLKALSFGPLVVRKGGADRYETAALLSAHTFPKTGAVSCPGVGFFPDSNSDYAGADERWRPLLSAESFFCEVSLPHRATVTRLSAGINDTSALIGTPCRLRRIDIVGGRVGEGICSEVIMATTASSSQMGASGAESLSTTDIDQPVVNNSRYGYYVNCFTNQDLKIIGATVEYELTG